jgi:DNA anti-recombination protein RmuC
MWVKLMAFQPDILVTTPDGQVMVIEAKVTMSDLPRTEEALTYAAM